jgi:thiol-disulfide isomerase/thioredoxin
VLEFWATWCAPCVEQISHLNELADKLAGKPIQFVSITDESSDLITDFLKKRPISGMIALNPSKSQSKAYGVVGIPHTVLVDAKGIIAGITMPQMLNESILGDLVDGKPIKVTNPIQLSMPNLRGDSSGSSDSNPALIDILIRPSTAGNSSGVSMMPGALKMTGMSLRYAITNIYHVDAEGWEVCRD